MKIEQIAEARHIGHSLWEQFKNELRRTHKNLASALNEYNFQSYFEEMALSFDFFYDMHIFYMDEEPEEYTDEDRDPVKLAKQWFELYVMDPQTLTFELSSYEQLSKEVPEETFANMTIAIGDWISRNARHIVT